MTGKSMQFAFAWTILRQNSQQWGEPYECDVSVILLN